MRIRRRSIKQKKETSGVFRVLRRSIHFFKKKTRKARLFLAPQRRRQVAESGRGRARG